MSLPVNQVVVGDCVEVMREWPADSVDLVVTSPPYWGLRFYGEETVRVWGGLPECEHEWNEQTSSFSKQGGEGKQSTNLGTLRGEDQKSDFCSICSAWRGSLGLEPHPQMFIDHLVEVCREIKRVLKPSGTFWLNLGDTYFTGAGKSRNPGGDSKRGMDRVQPASSPNRIALQDGAWLQPKQKLMIPARVAIALQHDGWILRNSIIWHKPNHMPSSVKDRLTNAYEHVFLFAKARRYYFDLDSIRQPHSPKTILRSKSNGKGSKWVSKEAEESRFNIYKNFSPSQCDFIKGKNPGDVLSGSKYLEQDHPHSIRVKGGHTGDYTHPRGKNPGDFWSISTMPFPGAHFATFPPKLIEPIIKAGSPQWICSRCGKPRERITTTKSNYEKREPAHQPNNNPIKVDSTGWKAPSILRTEWSDCGCGEKWVGGIVLDPFGGSGTVGQVARKLGRRFIIIEIKHEYAEMARQRVRGHYKPIPEGVTPFKT